MSLHRRVKCYIFYASLLLCAFILNTTSRYGTTSINHDHEDFWENRFDRSLHKRSRPTLVDALSDLDEGLSFGHESGYPHLVFKKRPETKHVDCHRLLENDERYIESIARKRPKLRESSYDMSCDGIRKRVLPPVQPEQLKFGVAYARVVYEDYIFIEDELRSSYHYQNHFCYFLDKSAGSRFAHGIRMLAKCFPNVYVAHKRLYIDSGGHFMNFAYYECLKILIQMDGWQYTLLLQNYDLLIKSIKETVTIYELLGGVNDVPIRNCPDNRCLEIAASSKWDARSLHLFKNESAAKESQLSGTLNIAKGSVQASLSRAAIDWMINTVNLTTLMHKMNKREVYGVDELLIPSLQVSDDFDMPGRFTSKCLSKKFFIPAVTRISFWDNPQCRCPSGKSRNGICILGVEDLDVLSKSAKLMANKVIPSFDYAVVDCIHEIIFNKTYRGLDTPELNLQLYRDLNHVQFHQNRLRSQTKHETLCNSNKTLESNTMMSSRRKCR